jgi:hypothetical protein
MLLLRSSKEHNKNKQQGETTMTINEMVNEMEKNYKAIMEIRTELDYRQKEKVEPFKRCMKHFTEWAFMLTQRVITNHKKAEITVWYKQSCVALRHAKRIQSA